MAFKSARQRKAVMAKISKRTKEEIRVGEINFRRGFIGGYKRALKDAKKDIKILQIKKIRFIK